MMNLGSGKRIAAVAPDAMTSEQQAAAAALTAGPRKTVRGPFAVLLNSPGVFGPTQALGAYLRFESPIPANLRELAILVTARHWRQEYEWQVHSKLACDAGLSEEAIAAIAAGIAPAGLTQQEAVVYDFCRQLHESAFIEDETYKLAEELLTPASVIDLTTICGYYAMLAMVMNVARNPLPECTPFSHEPHRS